MLPEPSPPRVVASPPRSPLDAVWCSATLCSAHLLCLLPEGATPNVFTDTVHVSVCFMMSLTDFSKNMEHINFLITLPSNSNYKCSFGDRYIVSGRCVTWSRSLRRAILLVTSSWAKSSFSCSSLMLVSCRRRFSLCTHVNIPMKMSLHYTQNKAQTSSHYLIAWKQWVRVFSELF